MDRALENRINMLENTIKILEDHLNEYGHKTDLKSLNFISEKLHLYKRELQIRKDYPSLMQSN
jgi:hypothetical protein